jgi:hypothetical protein
MSLEISMPLDGGMPRDLDLNHTPLAGESLVPYVPNEFSSMCIGGPSFGVIPGG